MEKEWWKKMPIKNEWPVKSHLLTREVKKMQSGQKYSGLVPGFLQPGSPKQCSEHQVMGCMSE